MSEPRAKILSPIKWASRQENSSSGVSWRYDLAWISRMCRALIRSSLPCQVWAINTALVLSG